jgi:hypothetical protein
MIGYRLDKLPSDGYLSKIFISWKDPTAPSAVPCNCRQVSILIKSRLDSSLRNVKQNDFNNEAAGSGCGDVKQNNFKIDHILDGFVSAIIGVFESAV